MDVQHLLENPFRCADDSHTVLVAVKRRVRTSIPTICSHPRTGLDVPSKEHAYTPLARDLDRLQAYSSGPRFEAFFIILVRGA